MRASERRADVGFVGEEYDDLGVDALGSVI
jgi:hypothetical protein